ncbi:MAG: NUDIX domain-containing protein [Cytophagaceae bacterium]|jgi:bifunctional NMN adenylyltransferase/nudix hydrolase|nr:NUDIX domain-containing protein [Cytophagaceae bacterium]
MEHTNEDKDVGVIVGRFQVHDLHEAHRQIIESVMQRHKKVIIFLGVTPAQVTKNNPLDFVARKEMILQAFPAVTVMPIPDTPDDHEWSRELDSRIREACPVNSIVLYGGRDSFINYYFGGFETRELEQTVFVSGTEVRKNVSREVKSSADFRAGVIYAAYNQYPKVFPTVDVAILQEDKVLLGKKSNQEGYRFLGGFTDPTDNSYEEAAKREVMEEANIEIGDLRYLGSAKIDDWRYRKEEDKIITHLFAATFVFGAIEPKDDISELKWFSLHELKQEDFVKEHHVLFQLFQKNYSNKKS